MSTEDITWIEPQIKAHDPRKEYNIKKGTLIYATHIFNYRGTLWQLLSYCDASDGIYHTVVLTSVGSKPIPVDPDDYDAHNGQPTISVNVKDTIKDIKKQSRMNEKSVWHGKDYFDFSALSEAGIEDRRKGATYLLSDNMGGNPKDKWKVAVFVKNVKEEQELKALCWEGGYMRFNGGEEIYDFGRCEVNGYPATISTDEFVEMFGKEQQGMHTLHNYCN